MLSPNGIDFRLTELFMQEAGRGNVFVLGQENKKHHLDYYKIPPLARNIAVFEDDKASRMTWAVEPGMSYDFNTNVVVNIPPGVAAVLYTRSTLIRNGLFITAGVYDSGYRGSIGGHLHSIQTTAILEVGARIGQVIFMSAANASVYSGSYNNWERTTKN